MTEALFHRLSKQVNPEILERIQNICDNALTEYDMDQRYIMETKKRLERECAKIQMLRLALHDAKDRAAKNEETLARMRKDEEILAPRAKKIGTECKVFQQEIGRVYQAMRKLTEQIDEENQRLAELLLRQLKN